MHNFFYANGTFDRSAQRREDQAWLKTQLSDVNTRFYPIWHLRHLVESDAAPQLRALDPITHGHFIAQAETVILLGVEGEIAHFAIDLSDLDETMAMQLGSFQELRGIGPLLSQRDGALLAYARGLAYWHQRHRFCGVCGSPTEIKAAGHQRQCISRTCATVQFPRTDPAVIMRVTCGNQILMARQAIWNPGMHSVLAGFVETGESLEDAVAREVFEEVGLRVHNIKYFGSQPWPFPSSLMLGFTAEAENKVFDLRDGEIESAQWMTRMDLLSSPESDRFRLPRVDSISRRLIEDWIRL